MPAVYSWWPFVTVPLTASRSLYVEGGSRLQLRYIVCDNSTLNSQQLHKGAKDTPRNEDFEISINRNQTEKCQLLLENGKEKILNVSCTAQIFQQKETIL